MPLQATIIEPRKITVERNSNHSSLTEGDVKRNEPWTFQSISIHTSLAEGDPTIRFIIRSNSFISIHAFLAEGDEVDMIPRTDNAEFQSTPFTLFYIIAVTI